MTCPMVWPKTIHDLWKEWQFGGLGRTLAKDFNIWESGGVKKQYCLWRLVWDKVAKMVRAGMAA